MGPPSPDHSRNHSSESDEDNVRHDRFKSERFKNDTVNVSRQRCERDKHTERYMSHRNRERSPKSHRHRETSSSSSSNYKNQSRSNHDRKSRDQKYNRSRTCEIDTNEKRTSDKKDNDTVDKKAPLVSITSSAKSNLSSLLKSFDKQIETKRTHLENHTPSQSVIGPALPLHLQKSDDQIDSTINADTDSSVFGPALPPQLSGTAKDTSIGDLSSKTTDKEFGVALPPHIKTISSDEDDDKLAYINLKDANKSDEKCLEVVSKSDATQPDPDIFGPTLPPQPQTDTYGPSLPPKEETSSYGPALPPSLKKTVIQGPALPPEGIVEEGMSEDDDEDLVGPLPEGKMNMTQYKLGLRALDIKRKLDNEKSGTQEEVKKREEWMLELPPEKAANLGLGPRNFRMREAPDMSKRSEWTDTPADKLRKLEQAQKGEAEPVNNEEVTRTAFVKERDEAMEKLSKQHKEQDRPLSLLELHQKKLKKKKKKEEKEGTKKERRPFDRNIDLQVHRFDDAQKKAIFKKAQLLDTRFSSGESKFL